jgi:hypothetical protein
MFGRNEPARASRTVFEPKAKFPHPVAPEAAGDTDNATAAHFGAFFASIAKCAGGLCEIAGKLGKGFGGLSLLFNGREAALADLQDFRKSVTSVVKSLWGTVCHFTGFLLNGLATVLP